jgi:hypothetical protein
MKTCSRCGVQKPPEEFSWRNKSQGKRAPYCRECMRTYLKRHYTAKKPYYLDKAKRRNEEYRREVSARIRDYLATHPCTDCGETDVLVLEFDHVDCGAKLAAVSEMLRAQRPWRVIEGEIAKCQVRCANCHRRRTAAQQNWLAYILQRDA